MGVLSTKTVYKAKYFSIIQKEIERNGKRFTKDFIERNSVVSILPLTDQGELYLEKQYRDAFGKEILEIVAGTMDNDDNPLEAAKRELQEETGLTATTWKQLATWELSVNMNSKQYIFVATGLSEGKSQLDDDEEITLVKISFEQAVEKVISGEICASVHAAAILLYDKLKKEGIM